MNNRQKIQRPFPIAYGMTHCPLRDSAEVSERSEIVELLQQYQTIATQLHQYVHSLVLRVRNVSFIEVHQLFHRMGEATEQCAKFLDERIHDLCAFSQRNEAIIGTADRWYDLSFAACIHHITEHTHALTGFTAETKKFMDRAVISGDYNLLHVMTDCIYQISRLVALIQILLPADTLSGSGSAPAQAFRDK